VTNSHVRVASAFPDGATRIVVRDDEGAAAGAIYLVLGQPFAGLMQISSAPLRNALMPL
jgi:hypothetical protein